MNLPVKQIAALLRGNVEAGRVVPRSGMTRWLTVLSAATMTAVAALAVLIAHIGNQTAEDWANALALSVTVQIDGGDAERAALASVLATNNGVRSYREISVEAQKSLLAPVLGDALSDVDLPVMFAVQMLSDDASMENLRLALDGALPDAVLNDNGGWRRPMIRAAAMVSQLGRTAGLLALLAVTCVVVLAVEAVIASNRQNIQTLRLIGAADRFIVRAFVRQITVGALAGAGIGLVLGLIMWNVLYRAAADLLPNVGFWGWLAAVGLVPLVGVIAFVATRGAAFRALRRSQ